MIECCGQCRYNAVGQCRRYPPTLVVDGHIRRAAWPPITAYDFCGEFCAAGSAIEPKEESEPLNRFLAAATETGPPGTYTFARDAFTCFERWYRGRGGDEPPWTETKFGREIGKRFAKRKICGRQAYLRLRLAVQ